MGESTSCRVVGGAILLCVIALSASVGAQIPSAPLTRGEQEAFLATADILSVRKIGIGVTLAERATLALNGVTHDAQIQCVDVYKAVFRTQQQNESNFRDSYRYNIAGYVLDKLLDLQMVPVSVERRVAGKPCAVTWWIDDVLMDDKTRREDGVRIPNAPEWALQHSIVTVFDALIYNTDRHSQNLLIDQDWKLWMVDHTRAFRTFDELNDVDLLQWCDGLLLEGLRGWDATTLTDALSGYLSRWEISGLAARAKLIVDHFDRLSEERGERRVLFDWLPRSP